MPPTPYYVIWKRWAHAYGFLRHSNRKGSKPMAECLGQTWEEWIDYLCATTSATRGEVSMALNMLASAKVIKVCGTHPSHWILN